MPEEFKWLGQDKSTRGARQDEAIQVIRLLLGGGMVEFHGKYFDFDRLIMAPVPAKRIPITSAVRHPGPATGGALWRRLGGRDSYHGSDQESVVQLNQLRREFGPGA